MRHLRLAFRALFRTPFVTSIAVASLGLGIGANTAIFSLFHALLLAPLPVPDSQALVSLSAPGPKPGSHSCGNAGDCSVVFSYPMFRDLEREQTVFTGIAAHRTFNVSLAFGGESTTGMGVLVSGSYFPVLGLQPAAGRLIGPDDDRTIGGPAVVVLSHDSWLTRFGGRPDIVGQTIVVNGQTLAIVGVAPRGFTGTTLGVEPEVFVPITLRGLMEPGFTQFDNRRSYWVYLFARLGPGVGLDQARTAINVPYRHILREVEAPLQRGMTDATMAQFLAKEVVVEPGARGQSTLRATAQTPLTLLLAVAALVLFIACANIANLLLARSAARAAEMSIRLSLGAARTQLIAQLLVESCLLAALGSLAGLVVARWTLVLMASLLPPEQAGMIPIGLDGTMLLFALAVALATGLLFGLFPALHSTRPDLVTALKNQAGQPAGARTAARFRATLATAQIALSMALLVAAGLFARSLSNVARTNLGIRTENLVTFSVSPRLNGYTPERSRILFERLEEELAAQPGVVSVSAALVASLAGNSWGTDVFVEGFPSGPDTDDNSRLNEVGPGYFATMGIPLLRGREFTPADTIGAPKVAVVNEAFARKFNLGADAVGKRMSSTGRELDIEIVGLAADAKYSEVKGDVPPLFYRPYRQDPRIGALTFYVRTARDEGAFFRGIRDVVARLDPHLPIEDLRTMAQQVRENVFLDRFISVLSTAFATLATLLAAVGLYGVLAYTVAQRTREIGLRMALGAAPGRVRAMVLRQVGLMMLVGGTIGLAAAWGVGSYADSVLYQMHGRDHAVLASSACILTIVALVAGLIPAHRASRVDPMLALQHD